MKLKSNVFIRALQRNINPDLIEDAIKKGKIEKFGKNYVKFITQSVICAGEMSMVKYQDYNYGKEE